MQGGKAGMTPLCPVYTIVKEGCCTYKKGAAALILSSGTHIAAAADQENCPARSAATVQKPPERSRGDGSGRAQWAMKAGEVPVNHRV